MYIITPLITNLFPNLKPLLKEYRNKNCNGKNAPALEARLAKTLVEALAQRPSRDLRVKFAAEPGVAVPLECCIWPPAAREEVRGD